VVNPSAQIDPSEASPMSADVVAPPDAGAAEAAVSVAPPALRGAAGKLASKFYNRAQLAKLSSYSWNIFRYIGDYLHLFGVFALLATLYKNKSCQGISRSTQILYFLVFITRYLDLLEKSQAAYLVFFKITYIVTSVIILGAFWRYDASYERKKDTCSMSAVLLPCCIAVLLFSEEYSPIEMLWTFSQFCEGVAMVPQYIFCYRDRGSRDIGVIMYVLSMGTYRVFYAANWIYKKVQMPHYSDIQSWIGGLIEILFFADYLLSFTGMSLLRSLVLKVDEKINEIKEKVEMTVFSTSSVRRGVDSGDHELRQRRKIEEEADPVDL
jgi:ER lumen protein retaining receptor